MSVTITDDGQAVYRATGGDAKDSVPHLVQGGIQQFERHQKKAQRRLLHQHKAEQSQSAKQKYGSPGGLRLFYAH
jgi:uncharacterized protein (DUF934 family)